MPPMLSRVLTGLASLVVVTGAALGVLTDEPALTLGAFGALAAVGTGWVVVRHDPRTPVGAALAWTSACVVAVLVNDVLAASASEPEPLPLSGLARHWWVGAWPVNLAGLFALLLVFPDGARAGRLWSVLPWVYGAATVGMVAAEWDAQQVDGQIVGDMSGLRLAVASVSMPIVGICLALAVASVVVRYRRGVPRTRRQIRWLMLAGGVVLLLLVTGWVLQSLGLAITVAYAPFLLAIVVLIPITVGIAVVRHDLFDIDRILSRSVIWLLTLVLSAAVFGAVVVAVGQVVDDVTGIDSATAAFVTALVLAPLHRLVHGAVGRVVDRDRYVAVAEVERFAADVRARRREPEEVETVLRGAQGDPDLTVLLADGDGRWVTMGGTPAVAVDGFTVEAGGEAIARIALGWDSARARSRIADLSRAAWVPIEVARLRLVLRTALDEARASRARLAEAAADERRRLERDLHDGAQQRIVATGLRLRLLQLRLPQDQAAEVDAAVSELQETVDELRRLAHGVRPSRLDDGLEAALSALRDVTPIPIDLHVVEVSSVDDTRALTAYLVVTEAVANALKHARASHIDVRVAGRDGRLDVEVTDDGVGGVPEDAPLRALRDRALSIGGSLGVVSSAAGTTITAVI